MFGYWPSVALRSPGYDAVLEEVVVDLLAGRQPVASRSPGQERRRRSGARDDDGLRRHLQHLPALRHLAVVSSSRPGCRSSGRGAASAVGPPSGAITYATVFTFFVFLFLPVPGRRRLRDRDRPEEDVPARRAVLRARLHRVQERVQALRRVDVQAARVDRRRLERRRQVVELELRGLADDRRRLRRVVHAGELDHDLVGALLADLRRRDAELVDAVPHDRDRAVEVARLELVPLRRLRLEHDLEAALQVEALLHAPVERRAGHGQEADSDERQRRSGRRERGWSGGTTRRR